MQDSVKNYWKLGKDQFGDTLWMEKPRKAPNGYWETCMVYHYGKGTYPGKGSSRLCACMADYVMNATAFEGVVPEEKRYKFLELMRAIVISSRYHWMLKRGNTEWPKSMVRPRPCVGSCLARPRRDLLKPNELASLSYPA